MNVFLEEHNIIVDERVQQNVNTYRSEGKVSIIIADKDHIIGIIVLSDTMRRDTADMLSAVSSLAMKNSTSYGGIVKKRLHILAKSRYF